jgi:hypothetical protein
MLSNKTIEALRFFALPQSEKIRYLPVDSESVYYVAGDGSEMVLSAEAAMRAAFFLIDTTDTSDEVMELLKDMNGVIYMMLGLCEIDNYIWFLDKERYRTTGPYDRGWLVLKRLATLALRGDGLDLSPPQMTFAELLVPIGIKPGVRGTSNAQS